MLSLIAIKCPHCGSEGKIMMPPLGAIIIGPCPHCDEMVVIFCGRALPLEKAVMREGAADEKEDHLLQVLGSFLEERVQQIFHHGEENDDNLEVEGLLDGEEDEAAGPEAEHEQFVPVEGTPISEDELANFRTVELKLLDNKDYFRTVF